MPQNWEVVSILRLNRISKEMEKFILKDMENIFKAAKPFVIIFLNELNKTRKQKKIIFNHSYDIRDMINSKYIKLSS